MCKIKITQTTSINDVKDWFSKCFPLLKIELYKKVHDQGEGSEASELISKDDLLSSLGYTDQDMEFIIFEDYSTNLVEHMFFTKLGINAQVFRLNKNTWIQTISTDNWTLKEQMKKAQEYQEDNVA